MEGIRSALSLRCTVVAGLGRVGLSEVVSSRQHPRSALWLQHGVWGDSAGVDAPGGAVAGWPVFAVARG